MSSLACVDVCETAAQGRRQSQGPPTYQSVHLIPLGGSSVVRRITQSTTRLKRTADMTSLTYAGLNLEVQAAASHAAGEIVVEALDDLDNAQRNPIGSQNAP